MKIKTEKEIKCIVWDLDNTLWDGTLLEDKDVKLKPFVKEAIIELDSRGILHSISSKNEFDTAIKKLKDFGIAKYFLYPEIHWSAKSESIKNIQTNLNIGMDTLLFIDDQAFERDEVLNSIPELNVIDVPDFQEFMNFRQLNPRFITKDSKRRRKMYLDEIERNKIEELYIGPKEGFLASLNMKFTISVAQEEDLARAEELTIRTNQLNTTGRTFSFSDLKEFINSEKHLLLVCELEDKYGSYGKIGLALIEIKNEYWYLHLLLMSCRVISRSVGSILLSYIMNQTKNVGKILRADFKQTSKNRIMYATYKFANFKEVSNENGNIVFENDLSLIQKYPHYVEIIFPK